MIGRLSGHTALVNCIALEEKRKKEVKTEEEEEEKEVENEEEDFVASGSTDTTVRVGGQQLISGYFAIFSNFAILPTHHCPRYGG